LLRQDITTYKNIYNGFFYTGHGFPSYVSKSTDTIEHKFYRTIYLQHDKDKYNEQDIPVVLPAPIYCQNNIAILALSKNLKRGIMIIIDNTRRTVRIGEIFQSKSNPYDYVFANEWNFRRITSIVRRKLQVKDIREHKLTLSVHKIKHMHNCNQLFAEISQNYLSGITHVQLLILLMLVDGEV